MKKLKHGGDIYTYINQNSGVEPVDFSSNINPLGMPNEVKEAFLHAIDDCTKYPDPMCRALRNAIADKLKTKDGYIFCGNGAADVLYRLALALKPRTAIVPAPTFSEYEESLNTVDCIVRRYITDEKDEFAISDGILSQINDDVDIVYICNPNNPNGVLTLRETIIKVIEKCRKHNAYVVIDECFMDFVSNKGEFSLEKYVEQYKNLIILKAFTKIYAMAGIRLGYCITSDQDLIERLYENGQSWSVSTVAQRCGIAALAVDGYEQKTRDYIAKERAFLCSSLRELGFTVYQSHANYIMIKNDVIDDLSQKLAENSILIRSCGNYLGLDNRYFRLAVKSHDDNVRLIEALKEECK